MTSVPLAALNIGTIMAAVLVITTPAKALMEVWIPPEARAHDALVQLLALGIGVCWSLLVAWGEGGVTRSAQLDLVTSVLLGVSGGAAGVGGFHISKSVTSKDKSSRPPQR